MAGVDFIVNSVPTRSRGVAGVVTGDMVAAHRAGVAMARRVYATAAPADADVRSLGPSEGQRSAPVFDRLRLAGQHEAPMDLDISWPETVVK